MMSSPDEIVRTVLSKAQTASEAWMRGDASPYLEMTTKEEDFTIQGPFGGPALKGFDAYRMRARKIAQNFRGGSTAVNLVQWHLSGDLLVMVLDEQQQGQIGEGPEQSWCLRVTQVYRREAGDWKVVHRHADPLVRLRSLEEAKLLAVE